MITLSKSRINSYISCPEKYRLRYQMEIKPLKTSTSMVEGSCLHYLLQCGLMYGKHIHVDDVLELSSEKFWEENPFEICDYLTYENYQMAQNKCLSEAKIFLDQIGELDVVVVEKYLTEPLIDPITKEEINDINLNGYVDLIDVLNDQNRIIDIKTLSKRPQDGAANVALELTLYSYLNSYPDFDETPVGYLNLVRTKEPKVIWDESSRTKQNYIELINLCRFVADNISNQKFYRNIGFSCGICNFKSLCWNDEKTALETFGSNLFQYYQMERELYQTTYYEEVSYALN
jgi:hypothetical protein